MASVSASINVNVNTSNAAGGLAALQAQLAGLNKSMVTGANSSRKAQLAQAAAMGKMLNRSGMWSAAMTQMQTATGKMAAQFDKGTVRSFQEYRKNSKAFSRDHTAINQLAAQRVRALQTQYVALGKEVDGVQKVMKMQPSGMMPGKEWGSAAQFATQRAVLFRRNLEMGANSMINWGKNTQWAGRQMMVGMGIPLAIAAAGAVSSFKDIEAASISFKRVYGDATTSAGEKAKMLSTIQNGVAQDMTKYGIAVSDTIDVAAKAAATGQQGDNLVTATRETMRLATLGQMDYQTALESTIATQTAFGVKSQDMARVTDFMNAAENQTILSMEDMAKAIPRVAPVIKGLGGDVEDLGVLMTALRAGGITAEQGANALKSGLASLINPTSSATEAMTNFGIPLEKIVNANKGDLIGTVQDFGKALSKLPKFEQQQALASLFGKYQFARMGALFKNINSKQAKETAKLSRESSANLAKISEAEMSQISDSAMNKFQGAIERLKTAAAPLGEEILSSLAPVVDVMSKVVGFFADNDAARNVALFGAAFAGLAGVATMITGVFANFFGTMTKGAMLARRGIDKMMGRSLPRYSSIADLEAAAAQKQLGASAESAAAGLYAEAGAARVLAEALAMLRAEQSAVIANNGRMGPGGPGGVVAKPGTPLVPGGGRAGELVPPGAAPAGRQVYSHAQLVRAHFSSPRSLSPEEQQRVLSHYGPGSETYKKLVDSEGNFKSNIRGLSNQVMFLPDFINKNLAQTGVSGMEMHGVVRDIGTRILNPFIHSLAAEIPNSGGMDAFAQRPEIQRAAQAIHRDLSEAMLTRSNWTDAGFAPVASEIVNRHLRGISSEIDSAIDRTGSVTQLRGEGVGKINLAKGVLGGAASYERAKVEKVWGGGLEGVPALSAAQERGAVVLDKNSDAIEESTKTTEAATKKAKSPNGGNYMAGFNADPIGKGLMEKKPTQSGWMRQGGAFTGEQANKWSNRLFGMGMAADMVTMGLSTMGKDVPAWSHMMGMGAMTLGMFPGLIGKPAALLGKGLKSGAIGMTAGVMPALKSVGSKAKIVATGAAMLGTELMGLGVPGVIGGGLASLSSVAAGVVAPIAAAGIGAYIFKSTMDRASDAGADLAKTYVLSGDAVEAYASEVGKESLTAKANRKVISEATGKQVTASDMAARTAQLQSASGQIMLANARKALELGGPANVIDSISGQVSKLFTEGLVGKSGAIDLATTLGSEVGLNKQQIIELKGVITDITGPGIEKPIEVKLKAAAEQTDVESLASALGKDQSNRSMATGWIPGQDEKFLASNVAEVAKNTPGMGYKESIDTLMAMPGFDPVQQEIMKTELQNSIFDKFRASGADARLGADFNARLDEASRNQWRNPDRESLIAGASQVRLSAAQGDITDNALKELFNGDTEMQKQVLLTFAGADGKSVHAMNSLLGEQNKDGSMSSNASNYMNALKNADTEQKRAGIAAAAKEYASLPDGKKSISIDFQTQGADQIAKLRGIAKEIDSMPPSIQKRISIQVQPGQEAKVRNLMNDVNDFSDAAPGRTRRAINSLAGGQINNLGELRKVVGYLNQLKRDGKIKLDVKANDKGINKKPKTLKQKVDRVLGKDGSIKKPKSLRQMVNRAIGKDGSIKRPKLLAQLIHRIIGKDGSKQNPQALKQIVARLLGKDESEIPAKDMQQLINRLLGQRDDNINPTTLPQTINRLLGARGDLAPVPSLTQTINRVVKNSGLGAFGVGGYDGGAIRLARGGRPEPLSRAKFVGSVAGPGGPKDDMVPAWLSDGEFVMKAASVKKYGVGFMHDVNAMRLAKGGDGKSKDTGKKKDSGGDSGGKDKWSWKKDVLKAINEAFSSSRSGAKLLRHGKLSARSSAAIEQFGDDPKAMKKYRNMSRKERKKVTDKIIRTKRRQDKIDMAQEWTQFQEDLKRSSKANKARLKVAKRFGARMSSLALEAMNMDDTEARMVAKMGKGKRKRYLLNKKAEAASVTLATRTAELNQEASFNKRFMPGRGMGLSRDALNNISQEDYQAMQDTQDAADAKKARADRLREKAKRLKGKKNKDKRQDLRAEARGLDRQANASTKSLDKFKAAVERAAKAAKKAEYQAMSQGERYQAVSDQMESFVQTFRDQGDAMAKVSIFNATGKTQSQLEAENAVGQQAADVLSFENQKRQRMIDDMNKKYDKQQKILDKVEQSAQAILNIDKARASVASSLASGDIGAAASAMREAKTTEAQSGRDSIRAAMQDSFDAAVQAQQDIIDLNDERINAINDAITQNSLVISAAQTSAALAMANQSAQMEIIQAKLTASAPYWNSIRGDILDSMQTLHDVDPTVFRTAAAQGPGMVDALNKAKDATLDMAVNSGKIQGAITDTATQAKDAGAKISANLVPGASWQKQMEASNAAVTATKDTLALVPNLISKIPNKKVIQLTWVQTPMPDDGKSGAKKKQKLANVMRQIEKQRDKANKRSTKAYQAATSSKNTRDDLMARKARNAALRAEEFRKDAERAQAAGNINKMRKDRAKAKAASKDALSYMKQAQNIAAAERKARAKAKAKTKKASGGFVPGIGNTDSVHAMLTPGEFIVTKQSAQRFGPGISRLNSPSYKFASAPGMGGVADRDGGNVFNVTVNAAPGADANEIATIAVRKIGELESRSIRRRDMRG